MRAVIAWIMWAIFVYLLGASFVDEFRRWRWRRKTERITRVERRG